MWGDLTIWCRSILNYEVHWENHIIPRSSIPAMHTKNYRTKFESICPSEQQRNCHAQKMFESLRRPTYARSFQEMCGTLLRIGKQDDSETLQNIFPMHWWTSFQRRRSKTRGNCQTYVLKLFWNTRTWHLEVDKLARSITKWTQTFDKRFLRLISYIHHIC